MKYNVKLWRQARKSDSVIISRKDCTQTWPCDSGMGRKDYQLQGNSSPQELRFPLPSAVFCYLGFVVSH